MHKVVVGGAFDFALADWKKLRLSDLAQYHNGVAFKPADWVEDGLPIIRIEQLNNPDGEFDRYAGLVAENNRIRNGDLIFSWSATLKAIIWRHGDAVLNQHLFKVVPKPNIDIHFLHFVLDFNMEALGNGSHGSTMKHIKRSELDKFFVAVPSTVRQRKIASILSTIDTAIEQTEALIEKYQHIKAGLMHDLFTRGVLPNGQLRPPREQAPELYQETAIGWIPREWDDVSLGQIASFQRGHDIVETDFKEGLFPVVSSSGIIGYHSVATTKAPNVVIGRKGTIGKVHFLETDFWAHDTSLFTTDFFYNDPRFVFHLCIRLELSRFGTKSGSPSLNRNDIHPVRVGRPIKEEQIKIAKLLDIATVKLDAERRKIVALKYQKLGLMQDLLTGKVAVTVEGGF